MILQFVLFIYDNRVPQKQGGLFYAKYLHQIKHKSAGYIFNLKGGMGAPSNLFCLVPVGKHYTYIAEMSNLEIWTQICFYS